MKPTHT